MKFGFSPVMVSKMMFKVCGRWRTTEACLYYQIGLGEKKKRTESSTNHMVSDLCIVFL